MTGTQIEQALHNIIKGPQRTESEFWLLSGWFKNGSSDGLLSSVSAARGEEEEAGRITKLFAECPHFLNRSHQRMVVCDLFDKVNVT